MTPVDIESVFLIVLSQYFCVTHNITVDVAAPDTDERSLCPQYLPFQWPLLDVQGRSTIRDSNTPTHLVRPKHASQPPPRAHFTSIVVSNGGSSPIISEGFENLIQGVKEKVLFFTVFRQKMTIIELNTAKNSVIFSCC